MTSASDFERIQFLTRLQALRPETQNFLEMLNDTRKKFHSKSGRAADGKGDSKNRAYRWDCSAKGMEVRGDKPLIGCCLIIAIVSTERLSLRYALFVSCKILRRTRVQTIFLGLLPILDF